MNANELRNGNLLFKCYPDGKEITEVESISKHFVNGLGISAVEGIPLTEEWLLKFGFVYNGWSYLKGKYFFHAQMKNKNGEFQNTEFYVKDCLISYNIESAHQLQNLYFALTNKEL